MSEQESVSDSVNSPSYIEELDELQKKCYEEWDSSPGTFARLILDCIIRKSDISYWVMSLEKKQKETSK